MDKLVTVIVPIYNTLKYLNKCIDSILKQSWKEMEILLVDDGSTDGCYEICEKYRQADERVRVMHKKNGGLVSARKAGIQAAKGTWIAWVDADDWIEPDYIENLMKMQQDCGADIVAADVYFDIGTDSRRVRNGLDYGVYRPEEICGRLLYSGIFYEYGINPHIYTKLMPRELLLPVQLAVDNRIVAGEDAAVVYPCILKSNCVCIADVCGYHYVQRVGSMTKSGNDNEPERIGILFRYLEKAFIPYDVEGIFQRQLEQYRKCFLILRYIEYFDRDSQYLLLPYGGLRPGSRIVLYGAGGVGQRIYGYLTRDGRVRIVLWLDRNYEMYRAGGLDVGAPSTVCGKEETYDRIIIANSDVRSAEAIKKDLETLGVPGDKLLWFSEDFLKNRDSDWR